MGVWVSASLVRSLSMSRHPADDGDTEQSGLRSSADGKNILGSAVKIILDSWYFIYNRLVMETNSCLTFKFRNCDAGLRR